MIRKALKEKMWMVVMLAFLVALSPSIGTYGINDGGKIYSPSFLMLGGSQITSEKANVKIRSGLIYAQFTYTVDNTVGEGTPVVIALPRQTESGLGLKMDKTPIRFARKSRAALAELYPDAKLAEKVETFNVAELEIGAGTRHEFVISYTEKYTKGAVDFKLVADANHLDSHLGSGKITFDTGKMISTDIGNMTVYENQKTVLTTMKSGKATWTGEGALPKCDFQYGSSKEELLSALGKSPYKYPRAISAAMAKADYGTAQEVAEKYLISPSYQDPKLDMEIVRCAAAEAAALNKDYEGFAANLDQMDFKRNGSDLLAARMLYRALEIAKESGKAELAEKAIAGFQSARPDGMKRIQPILEKEGLQSDSGTVTLTPAPSQVQSQQSGTSENGTVGAKSDEAPKSGFFAKTSAFMKKIKLGRIFSYIGVFLLGLVVGVYYMKRRYRGTGKRSRTVYIG